VFRTIRSCRDMDRGERGRGNVRPFLRQSPIRDWGEPSRRGKKWGRTRGKRDYKMSYLYTRKTNEGGGRLVSCHVGACLNGEQVTEVTSGRKSQACISLITNKAIKRKGKGGGHHPETSPKDVCINRLKAATKGRGMIKTPTLALTETSLPGEKTG